MWLKYNTKFASKRKASYNFAYKREKEKHHIIKYHINNVITVGFFYFFLLNYALELYGHVCIAY